MRLADALHRLMAAYDAGTLVPFVGAGMSRSLDVSRPTLPSWPEFIHRLEGESRGSTRGGKPEDASPADLVRRANRAVRIIKRDVGRSFTDAVRRALYDGAVERSTPQTTALARMWWPLVLTTNYDDLLVLADRWKDGHDEITVLGRSHQDCQTLLSSLHGPAGRYLWALQGFLPRTESPDARVQRLAEELVVGHEEYRRVTHNLVHFRRAFAEVFRRRSLLFVGSGLSEHYFLDLFSEVLEVHGVNPEPHFALMKRGLVDTDFLRGRFNILTIEYDDHRELPRILAELEDALDGPRPRQTRWTYNLSCERHVTPALARDLELVRGPLELPRHDECAVVSAGWRNGTLRFGTFIEATFLPEARRAGLIADAEHGHVVEGLTYVRTFASGSGSRSRLAACVARGEDGYKDLRVIGEAVSEALSWAAGVQARRLRMQLLASGSTSHFPARYPLTETIRAFAAWRRAHPGARMRLRLYIVDPVALFELGSGRLRVQELLGCEDIRFDVAVVDDSGRLVERGNLLESDEATAGDVARQFDIPREGWSFKVEPAPRKRETLQTLHEVFDQSLRSLGVLPGCTIRFALLAGRTHAGSRAGRALTPSPGTPA